ncbi:MAG: ankyrin repeat domain-containing protein [Thermoguttaceae bacterium]
MGAFYCSINVRCDNQQTVNEVLKTLLRPVVACFISPCHNGWVSIFPDECDADGLSKLISQQMTTSVLYVNVHDSDVFCYSYYRNGQEIDSFCSNPDYFNQISLELEQVVLEKNNGHSAVFLELLSRSDDLEKLETALEKMKTIPLCEDDSDRFFCELLGLDGALNAYSYLKNDGFGHEEGFVHISSNDSQPQNSLDEVNKRASYNLIRAFETSPRHGPAVAFNQAAAHQLPSEINRMLDEGIDVNIQDQLGNTALHWATFAPTTKIMKKIIKLLLERGANPNIQNRRGETAIDLAEACGDDAIVQCFREHCSQRTKAT